MPVQAAVGFLRVSICFPPIGVHTTCLPWGEALAARPSLHGVVPVACSIGCGGWGLSGTSPASISTTPFSERPSGSLENGMPLLPSAVDDCEELDSLVSISCSSNCMGCVLRPCSISNIWRSSAHWTVEGSTRNFNRPTFEEQSLNSCKAVSEKGFNPVSAVAGPLINRSSTCIVDTVSFNEMEGSSSIQHSPSRAEEVALVRKISALFPATWVDNESTHGGTGITTLVLPSFPLWIPPPPTSRGRSSDGLLGQGRSV